MSELGLGFAAVMAFVIAPKSPYFVGNVLIFILASVLGTRNCLVMAVKSSLYTPLMSMSNAISSTCPRTRRPAAAAAATSSAARPTATWAAWGSPSGRPW